MQIVIDTNIIVSALLNPNGSAYIFMDSVFGGLYDVIISPSILNEYKEVLSRKKFGFSEDEISFIINWFKTNALLIEVEEQNYASEIIDKKDVPFYAAAKCTHSKLITGNIKHYPVEEFRTMLWELI